MWYVHCNEPLETDKNYYTKKYEKTFAYEQSLYFGPVSLTKEVNKNRNSHQALSAEEDK